MKRIQKADANRERFLIIVLMPLMPAFPAEVNDPAANTLRLVMHYQYQSINRGEYSIYSRLGMLGISAEKYIRFYALRTYDEIPLPTENIVMDIPAEPEPVPDLMPNEVTNPADAKNGVDLGKFGFNDMN